MQELCFNPLSRNVDVMEHASSLPRMVPSVGAETVPPNRGIPSRYWQYIAVEAWAGLTIFRPSAIGRFLEWRNAASPEGICGDVGS